MRAPLALGPINRIDIIIVLLLKNFRRVRARVEDRPRMRTIKKCRYRKRTRSKVAMSDNFLNF